MSNKDVVFYLENGSEIGILAKLPEENGNYQYEPFRGMGHYIMATQVQVDDGVKCYVYTEEKIIKFIVEAILEYGIVQIKIGWQEGSR